MSRIQNQCIHELTSFSQTPDNEKRMIDPQKGQMKEPQAKCIIL